MTVHVDSLPSVSARGGLKCTRGCNPFPGANRPSTELALPSLTSKAFALDRGLPSVGEFDQGRPLFPGRPGVGGSLRVGEGDGVRDEWLVTPEVRGAGDCGGGEGSRSRGGGGGGYEGGPIRIAPSAGLAASAVCLAPGVFLDWESSRLSVVGAASDRGWLERMASAALWGGPAKRLALGGANPPEGPGLGPED